MSPWGGAAPRPVTTWTRPVVTPYGYVTAVQPALVESGYIGPGGYGEIAAYVELKALAQLTIRSIDVSVAFNGAYVLASPSVPVWSDGPTTVSGTATTAPGVPLSYLQRGVVNQLGGVLLLGTLIHTFASGSTSWEPEGGIVLAADQKIGIAKIVGQTAPTLTVTFRFGEIHSTWTAPTRPASSWSV